MSDFTRIYFGIQVFRNVKLRPLISASRCFRSVTAPLSSRFNQPKKKKAPPSFEKLGPTYQNLEHQRTSVLLSRLSAWETNFQTTSNKKEINPIIIIKQSRYKTSGDQ